MGPSAYFSCTPSPRYYNIHGFVSLFVCIFGSVANILNIAVLTRRDMRSPTNAILTGLAIADLLVMLDYIPYNINEYLYAQFEYSRADQRTYAWAVIIYFHAYFSQTGHTISIFLTVTLAVWRYIAIAYPQKNRAWCNMRNTLVAITSSYLVCPLLCFLTFFVYKIVPVSEVHDANGFKVRDNTTGDLGETRNVTVYLLTYSDYIKPHPWIWPTYFWVFSVIIKIIPSIALTVLSLRLVGALLEAKRRRKQLMGNSNGMRLLPKDATNGGGGGGAAEDKKSKKVSRFMDKERQTDRTTRMLLAVLLLFLITEFPQGILGLLSASSPEFYHRCYLKLGKRGRKGGTSLGAG